MADGRPARFDVFGPLRLSAFEWMRMRRYGYLPPDGRPGAPSQPDATAAATKTTPPEGQR